jgi:hypothetical protein
METRILYIDAWNSPDGWTWNNWHHLAMTDIPEQITNRQLIRLARELGYLSDSSKGRVTVEDDGYNLVIMDRKTRQPFFAFCYGEFAD